MNSRQKILAKNIGNNVIYLRERSKLSQEELAKFLEVDLDYVISLEKGDRSISTVKLERISELFGCPTDQLMKEEVPKRTFDYVFHSDQGPDIDVEVIGNINRITLNLQEMQRLMDAGQKFHSKKKPS